MLNAFFYSNTSLILKENLKDLEDEAIFKQVVIQHINIFSHMV